MEPREATAAKIDSVLRMVAGRATDVPLAANAGSRYRQPVFATAYCLAQTLAISLPTVIDAARGRLTREACDDRMHSWAEKLVARTATRVTVTGVDSVDWSRAYVIMSNHQSHFDLPIVCYVVC